MTPVVNDTFGNVVGWISGGVLQWNTARVGSYGVLPDSTAPVFDGTTVPLAQSILWRSQRIDPTGFYYMGARYYSPTSGRFLSPDPLGHAASMSLYDYCNGDPVNGLDPDGRDVVPLGGGWNSFVNNNEFAPNCYLGRTVYNPNPNYSGQCATTAQYLTGGYDVNGVYHDAASASLNHQPNWVQGEALNASVPIGTMVATGFQNGVYPNLSPSAYHAKYGDDATVNHTGIFEGVDENGNYLIMNASKGSPIKLTPVDPNTSEWNVVLSRQGLDSKPSNSSLQEPENITTGKSTGTIPLSAGGHCGQ